MTPTLTHAVARYGGAVLATGAAFGLWHGLCGALGTNPSPYLTFYPAVMFTTTLWGWGPGLLAITLSTLLAAHWLIPPVGQFGIVSGADAVELGVFTGMGLALSVVAERYRRTRNRAAAHAQALMVQEERARLAADLDRQRQWLAVTLASIGDAVLATDPGGRLVFLNPAAEALTGWCQADALSQSITDVVRLRHAGIPAPAEDQLTLVLREGRPRVVDADTVLVTRGGQEIPLEGSAAPIRDASGAVAGVVVVLRDRTVRQRAEAALQQARDTLEANLRERTAALSQAAQIRTLAAERTLAEQRERRRLAGVLHDGLQQLLVAARLRAYMLGRSEDPGVQQGCREIITLLDEGLQEARMLTSALSPPGLQNGGLLAALEWLRRWMQEKHHLAVRVSPGAALSSALPEDLTVLLYQSVRELLFNVAKYARVDTAEVTILQQADGLTISVADAGIGFDPTRLRVAGGTEGGFGLLGIRERLVLLGGLLMVESTPGQGSRITMVAPPAPCGRKAQPAAEGS